MKINNLALVALIPVLASSVLARPGTKLADNAGPIPEKSRVTAFVSDDDGLRVECWEIGDLVQSVSSTPQHCDSKGLPRRTKMGVGNNELEGLDILTWPSYSPIWPPPSGYANTAMDIGAKPSLFTVKDGLIMIEGSYIGGESVDKDVETHIFSLENGDDWFYFEDEYSGSSAKRTDPPLNIRTMSGSPSTLIQFQYGIRPEHTVLHEGSCSFAGLKPAAGGAQDRDLDRARMTVQEL